VRRTAEYHHLLTPQHRHCQPDSVPLPLPPLRQGLEEMEGPAIDTIAAHDTWQPLDYDPIMMHVPDWQGKAWG
jgi:hypothetical protein